MIALGGALHSSLGVRSVTFLVVPVVTTGLKPPMTGKEDGS